MDWCRLLAGLALLLLTLPATAGAAEAPLRIGLMLSSDRNRCYEPATVRAIRDFAGAEVAAINARGGIGGRPLKLRIWDDYEDGEATVAAVREALADERLIGLVGLTSSTRAEAVFQALGDPIRASGLPIVSEISLARIFAASPTVYAMTPTVDDELQVIKRFVRDRGFVRPAFVGLADDSYSKALHDGLSNGADALTLVAERAVTTVDNAVAEAEVAALVASLKQATPDVLFLAAQSGPGAQVLKALRQAGVDVPVFVLYGRIKRILDVMAPATVVADMFELGRDGVPNVYSERLQERIRREPHRTWIFEDTPNKGAAGWSNGSCKRAAALGPSRVLDDRNRRAVGRGMQYRDLVDLFATAVAGAPAEEDVPALRRRVAAHLATLSSGTSMHRGLWQDWTFTPRRSATDDTLVVMRRPGNSQLVLAPRQYHRLGDALQLSPVVYLSLDLIGLSRIDSDEERFDAEFYLSMKSEATDLGIDSIEFTNADRLPGLANPITVRQIHDGAAGTSFPAGVKVYKVTGKFTFDPDLASYPFDVQRLAISFQPASTSRPFLIQPPAAPAEASRARIEGWRLLDSYVGSDQDVVATIDGEAGARRDIAFYKFNYTWEVKRIAVDFYLRVLVPLAFILLVTYFSVFLSEQRFDSIMAVQVTALLSAIALYLALPDVESDEATLSDRVFMLTYAAVSAMIGLSVLRDSSLLNGRKLLHGIVVALQLVVFPLVSATAIGALIAWTSGAVG